MSDLMQVNQTSLGEVIEGVVIGGDLSKLSPEDRVKYYKAVCQSVGLNPLTRPFDYITLNKKLTLYARKDAADQLRNINSISIGKPDIQFEGDWIIVTVVASDKHGRTDSDVGVVKKTDMQGNFGNALMKAVTKSKRRVTLSICGLGMLDETEVETIPDAQVVEADLVQVDDLTGPSPSLTPLPTEPQPELLPPSNGDVFDAVVAAGLSVNAHGARAVLQNYCRTGYDTDEKAIAWMRKYRGWKEGHDLTTTEAAAKANLGESPK